MSLVASLPRSLPRTTSRGRGAIAVFVVAAVVGVAAGHAHRADPADYEPALAMLLRFMAALKAAGALAALGALLWRLRAPMPAGAYATAVAALAAMAAAPGLIWGLGLVAPGALVFHAGLVAALILVARDDGAVPGLRARR